MKTDHRDSTKLATLPAGGFLKRVYVLSPEERAHRQLPGAGKPVKSWRFFPMRFPILLCCVAVMSFCACARSPASRESPETEMVRQLSQRRIVMLGDFAHETSLAFHGLISTLHNWLTMVEEGQTERYHLTLFLEEDKQTAHLINQYVKNGNLDPILDYLLPSTTLERLEFYADLRRIATTVDSLNGHRLPSRQISFDVEGPETESVLDTAFAGLSAREGRLYYVKDRDSLTAINVVSYLNQHPGTNALMFFGNGHLIRNRVQKDFSGVLTTEESKGMFLGHYLKQAFGDDQVFTISCVGRTWSRLRLDEFAERDAFVLSARVPWKDSPPEDNDLVPDNFDAFVIRDGFLLPGHPLRFVLSRRVADAAMRRLELLQQYRAGAKGGLSFAQALASLSFLCDTSFSDVENWRTWLDKHPIGGLSRLQSREFRERVFEQSSRTLGTKDFGRHIDNLIALGFDSRVGAPTMTREEWKGYLTAQWPQIVFLNAIGIYWTGYSEESARAREYLVRVSGEDLTDPSEYLKWWRREFYGLTY